MRTEFGMFRTSSELCELHSGTNGTSETRRFTAYDKEDQARRFPKPFFAQKIETSLVKLKQSSSTHKDEMGTS